MSTWLGTLTFSTNSKYNYYDLNRVNTNIQYLSDYLSVLGYNTAQTMKVDYTRTDFPKVSDINATRAAINRIIAGFYLPPSVPSIVVNSIRKQIFDFNKANALELNLQALYDIYNLVSPSFKYSGTFVSGQDIIL